MSVAGPCPTVGACANDTVAVYNTDPASACELGYRVDRMNPNRRSRYHLLYLPPMLACAVLASQLWDAVACEAAEPQSGATKILLDTDPGGDDVFALLWLQGLAKQGLAEIVAVTTVEGNVKAQYTFTNASKTLALGGFEHVEVGRSVVAREQAEDAAYIHGADGMGNLSRSLPEPKHQLSEARRADKVIIDKLAPRRVKSHWLRWAR